MSTTKNKPRELYHHQKVILHHIKPRDRVALFVDMRLGKTLCAIRWLKHKNPKRTLIICPLSVIDVWDEELSAENVDHVILRSSNKEMEAILPHYNGVIVTNYHAVLFTSICEQEWDCVILDESQKIRDPQNKSKIAEAILNGFKNTELKVILTGTPNPESALDYFTQLQFLDPKYQNSVLGYTDRRKFAYCCGTNFNGRWRPNLRTIDALRDYLKEHCIVLRRSNPIVADHFKNQKIYEKRFCDFEPKYRKLYDKFEKLWMTNPEHDNMDIQTRYALVAQNYLHQMSGGYLKHEMNFDSDHKLKTLKEVIEDELDTTQQAVIWVKYKREAETIRSYLHKHCTTITGEVPQTERKNRNRFWSEGNCRFLIAQIQTVSEGISFKATDTAIYYSNSWENVHRLQSEDRILAPTNPTLLYIDILTKNCVDEDLYHGLMEKKKNMNLSVLRKAYTHYLKRSA